MTKAELIKDVQVYKKLARKYFLWYDCQLTGNKSRTLKDLKQIDERIETDFKVTREKIA